MHNLSFEMKNIKQNNTQNIICNTVCEHSTNLYQSKYPFHGTCISKSQIQTRHRHNIILHLITNNHLIKLLYLPFDNANIMIPYGELHFQNPETHKDIKRHLNFCSIYSLTATTNCYHQLLPLIGGVCCREHYVMIQVQLQLPNHI